MSIIGAATTFFLARLELHDKRKRYFGLQAKTFKAHAANATLILAVLTLVAQNSHDFSEQRAKDLVERKAERIQNNKERMQNKRERYADSVQRTSLNITLQAINQTVLAQKRTQKSTEEVLFKQKRELDNEAKIITQEK